MTNPYIRAAAKHPHIRQQAQERLGNRPDHAGRPEWVDDKPGKLPQTPPGKPDTIDVQIIERARDELGRFIPDDPTTPDVNEAWRVVPEPGKGKPK
jgi:hypothetical protein